MTRHSTLSPLEQQQVHDASVAAQLFPVHIEIDTSWNLVFHAGEKAFEYLADFLKHAHHLAEIRRAP